MNIIELFMILTCTTLTTKKRLRGRETRTRSMEPRVMKLAKYPGTSPSHWPCFWSQYLSTVGD